MKYLVPGEKYVTFCLQHFSMSWSIFSSCVGVNLQLCSWPEPMSLQRLVYRRTEATTKSLYGNIVGSSFRQSHLRHFDVHRNGDRRSSIWGNRSSFRNSSGERPVVSLAFHLYAGKKDCCLSCVLARQMGMPLVNPSVKNTSHLLSWGKPLLEAEVDECLPQLLD